MAKKFYAVYHGMSGQVKIQGVFAAVDFKKEWTYVPGNLYKGFNSQQEAVNWLTFIKQKRGDESEPTGLVPILSSLPCPPLKISRKIEEDPLFIDRATSPIVFPKFIRRNLIPTKPDSTHDVDSPMTSDLQIVSPSIMSTSIVDDTANV
ncbi:hypothetical protein RCL1_005762 [Eukaryota sp. TZLM3-RCL]